MTFYGIKLNGKPLGWESSSNDGGEFCVGVQFTLDKYGDSQWLVSDKKVAEEAMVNSTMWWNASYSNPTNPYLGEKLELFFVEI